MTVRTPSILVVLTAVVAIGGEALADAPSSLPDPVAVLGWGDGPLAPGLDEGGAERQPRGPSLLSATEAGAFISDDVHRRVLVLAPSGEVVRAVPTSFPLADVRAAAGGGLAMLGVDLDTVELFSPTGELVRRVPVPEQAHRVRGLGVGPSSSLWVTQLDGTSIPLGDAAAPAKVATPLGPTARTHAVGRRTGERSAEVLVWAWGSPAELKGRGPSLVIPITTDRRLGVVRPLSGSADGATFVLVETLSDGVPLEVRAEVRRFDGEGRLTGAVALDPAGVAPMLRGVDVAPDGTLYAMQPKPEGLAVWRVRPAEWQAKEVAP